MPTHPVFFVLDNERCEIFTCSLVLYLGRYCIKTKDFSKIMSIILKVIFYRIIIIYNGFIIGFIIGKLNLRT